MHSVEQVGLNKYILIHLRMYRPETLLVTGLFKKTFAGTCQYHSKHELHNNVRKQTPFAFRAIPKQNSFKDARSVSLYRYNWS